jgi:hypothetical protein
VLFAAAKKNSGWNESFGGDATLSEFQSIGLDIVATLKNNSQTILNNDDLDLLGEAVNFATLECGKNLFVGDGVEKDAVNYPLENPKRIVLNCEKWNNSNYAFNNKVRLVAHEYIHLIYNEDRNYTVSSEISKYYFQHRSPLIRNGEYLTISIQSCDKKLFDQIVVNNTDLSFVSKDKMDLFHMALANQCFDIANDLVAMGYLPAIDPVTGTNTVALLIQSAANFYYSFQDDLYAKSIDLLRNIVAAKPAIVNEKFNGMPAGLTGNYSIELENDKCENKNMILALSLGLRLQSKDTTVYIGTTAMQTKQPVQMYKANNQFIEDLESIGFSIDAKDSCGRNARIFIQ